jgi:hypothetical protein
VRGRSGVHLFLRQSPAESELLPGSWTEIFSSDSRGAVQSRGALSKLGSPAVTAWALPLFVMLREALPLRRRGSVDQFVPHSGHGISGSATPNRPVAVRNRSCSGGDRLDRWPVARSGASLRRTHTAATAATRIRNNDQH